MELSRQNQVGQGDEGEVRKAVLSLDPDRFATDAAGLLERRISTGIRQAKITRSRSTNSLLRTRPNACSLPSKELIPKVRLQNRRSSEPCFETQPNVSWFHNRYNPESCNRLILIDRGQCVRVFQKLMVRNEHVHQSHRPIVF